MLARIAPVPVIALLAACAMESEAPQTQRYVAQLQPLNADVAGRSASGTATFDVTDDQLAINVAAQGLAPGMHLQHYHGFPDGADGTCPAADADANGDGIVDLPETEPAAGTTMVPFHGDPASLEIPSDTYPSADAAGALSYEQTVSLTELEQALQAKFDGASVDLDRRVVFIHGVAPETDLPESVQSLPGVPAHVTLPVACGVIERAG